MRSGRLAVRAGIALAVGAVLAAAPARAAIDDLQAWPGIAISGRIADGLLGTEEITARVTDDVGRLGQLEIRTQLGHPVSKSVTLWVGHVRLITYARAGRDQIEDQAVEQVSWVIGDVFGGTLASRTRLEQRFQRGVGEIAWRAREQLRWVRPLRKDGPRAVLWIEPFVSLNRTRGVPDGLDQLRSFAGVSVPVGKGVDLEAGYLNQYLNRRPRDQSNHVLSTTLNLRF